MSNILLSILRYMNRIFIEFIGLTWSDQFLPSIVLYNKSIKYHDFLWHMKHSIFLDLLADMEQNIDKFLKDIIRNVTSYAPELTVKDLPSASDFLISVYSYRNGQKSKVYNMEGFTVRPGEKQLATMREVDSEISYRQDHLVSFIFISKQGKITSISKLIR